MSHPSADEALDEHAVNATVAASIFIPFPSFKASESRPTTREQRIQQTLDNVNEHHAAVRQNIISLGRESIQHPPPLPPPQPPPEEVLFAINSSLKVSLCSNPRSTNPDACIKSGARCPSFLPPPTETSYTALPTPIPHPVAATLRTKAALEAYNAHAAKTTQQYKRFLEPHAREPHVRFADPQAPPGAQNNKRKEPPTTMPVRPAPPPPPPPRRTLSTDYKINTSAAVPRSPIDIQPPRRTLSTDYKINTSAAVPRSPIDIQPPRRASLAGPAPSPLTYGPNRAPPAPPAPMMSPMSGPGSRPGSGSDFKIMGAGLRAATASPAQAQSPVHGQGQGQGPPSASASASVAGMHPERLNLVDRARDPRQRPAGR